PRRIALRGEETVGSAARRRVSGYHSARPLSRQGYEGQRLPAGWLGDAADLDQRLGLQLAGQFPIHETAGVAEGDQNRIRVYLRQFGDQSAESVASAGARELGRGD